MSSNGNSGGPWGGGGGGNRGGGDNRNPWGPGGGGGNRGGGNRPNGGGGNNGGQGPGQVPDIDEIVRKGQEQLRVLMGGRGGSGGPGKTGGGGLGRGGFIALGLAAAGVWVWASLYTVQSDQQSVELTFGEFSSIGQPGLNFAPWPVVTYETVSVTTERVVDIGFGGRSGDGLMLTGDENIVDIDFQVVWNVNNPAAFIFNIADPEETIAATSESAMREVIARSELAPILNRDRGAIAQEVEELIQSTLDSYQSGVNIVRVNLDRADPPREVIDSFRDVQAAEQERDRLRNEADAFANRTLADARGESAQLLQEAEGYRAQVVNEAVGEASRFTAVLGEYQQAEDVTRRRLYIETMERVFGSVDKIIIEDGVGGDGGQGIVPYLPLNELRRGNN
ncbi:membrane protease subunit HflK [Rubricella aquisinus]|uniref:Protein HflK n=1 Tax=Rubricella aquisinus TaxID=2028108 RepID=A0A840X2M2_9RHOB|nr:FtsH protease activity modulator HflK [Rubricella aquisinus]MBB5516115.1 membrane protease subunit HflK [Rubricella aquisinus]